MRRTERLGRAEAEARAVASRPARSSLAGFFGDLRALLGFTTLKRAVGEFQRDDAFGLAAQLAFFLVLSLFPFILVLFSLLGTFSNPEFASVVLDYLRQVLPDPVYDLVAAYVGEVIAGRNPAPGLLSFGILFTLWVSSGAFAALIRSLNRAYDVEETRPFWKVRGLAILMTLGLSAMILIGVLLLVAGPPIGRTVANVFGLGEEFLLAWNIARWPAAFLFLVTVVALIYYLAPDANQPFRWITPGGFVGVVLWVLASLGFRLYVSNFGSFNETYGSIGAAIVLLLYLYVSSLTILFGAELNATLIRTKEELSGERIIKGEPADRPPGLDENGDR